MKKILIVEDDFDLSTTLKDILQDKNYDVIQAYQVKEALNLYSQVTLVILDINLPDGNGIDLCKKIRENSEVPILFLSARNDEETLVEGLESGGDDYITKPFSTKALLARISALLRRNTSQKSYLQLADLKFDLETYHVYKDERELELTRIQLSILEAFMKSNGRVLTRNYLLDFIENETGHFVEDNTLSVHIRRLRENLGMYQGKSYIETLRGIGYRWNILD